MRRTVCDQMKLAPHSASVCSMLPDFPFAFAEDFQTCAVDDEMRDFTTGWRFYTDVDGLCPLANQGVVRAVHRQSHQVKNESTKPCNARNED